MNLSPNFSLEELTFSSTALRMGIDNTAPSSIIPNLQVLAAGLEKVRSYLGGHPVDIDSGYRSVALNSAVGGVPDSAHLQGWAADFLCWDYGSPAQIVSALQGSGISFDQVIQEGTWVHISFAPTMRQQILLAHFGPPTTYSVIA